MEKPSYGMHEVGRFSISLAPVAGREHMNAEDCEFFEVLVHERKGGIIFYVDLAGDARFDWFGHLGKFERRLTHDDIAEYNAAFSTRFHKIGMPTWKLARTSLKRLEALCKAANKKAPT